MPFVLCVLAKGFSPIVTGEVDGLRDVVVGAQAAHHKLRKIDLRHGFQQIGKEDDIGIHVTHTRMPRGLFRLQEVSTHPRCAVFIHIHIREMTDSELGRDLRGALLIAEYEDVDIGMQTCPALDRVALNHPDVPDEGLRQSKVALPDLECVDLLNEVAAVQ